jgi:hypothetical protein
MTVAQVSAIRKMIDRLVKAEMDMRLVADAAVLFAEQTRRTVPT